MNLITQKITLPDRYTITADVEDNRNQIVQSALAVTVIANAEQNQVARNIAVELRTYLKDVEAARVILTKPLLDDQRKLKTLADDHVAPVAAELKRLERLATNYLEAEQRRVAEEEEARRVAYEKAEADRIKAEEAARKAALKMTTDAGMKKALVAEAKAQAAEQHVQEIIAAPMPEADRARGQQLRRIMKWEVTDIQALVKARPDLCKIEPKGSAIQSTCVPEMPNLPPGLKLWWETVANFTTR